MLLKALSQRADRYEIGWQTGGGHARERAIRPSPLLPVTRGAVHSSPHRWIAHFGLQNLNFRTHAGLVQEAPPNFMEITGTDRALNRISNLAEATDETGC